MSARERLTSWQCAEPGCRERVHYAYTSQREYRELYAQQAKRPWRCTRHSEPEKVLRLDNLTTEYVVVVEHSKRYPDLTDLFWIEPGRDIGCGFTYGGGYKAHANDFPEGTRLVVTARIELPIAERTG